MMNISLFFHPRIDPNHWKFRARVWPVVKIWFSWSEHWAIKRMHRKWSKQFACSKWSQRWSDQLILWQPYSINGLRTNKVTNVFFECCCYGLNVCFLQNSCWNLIAIVTLLRGWTFKRWLAHESPTLMGGTNDVGKFGLQPFLSFCLPPCKKRSIPSYQRMQPSRHHFGVKIKNPPVTLILDFPAFRTMS
jgi:hypothetical protein